MRMKFIAYDPETRQKVKLIEHLHNDQVYGRKIYYSDEKHNFVYMSEGKLLFDYGQYNAVMEVLINKKRFYLIGEY